MIGWLRGRLVSRGGDGEVLVDVQGVGYRVTVPAPVLAGMPEPGSEIELHVHTHVREDALVLYGFSSADERRCFEALLGAHGVGPSLALAILSALRPDTLVRAVLDDDLDSLCTVPGVGRKTAARLLLDLKAKLDLPDLVTVPVGLGAGGATSSRLEARAALVELGYGADEIRHALEGLDDSEPVELVLRQALRELAGSR